MKITSICIFILAMIHTSLLQTVTVDTLDMTNEFDPDLALCSSIDLLGANEMEWLFSEPIVTLSLSAGWGALSYRQNTELSIGAWHWNPTGTWSSASSQSGYFTGSTELGKLIRYSYGYPLPHRGNTNNAGTEGGYARMTDGDLTTYWKSNPYLTSKFTGVNDALHPQWVVIQFDKVEKINALKIDWADPFAKQFTVEYWTGNDAIFEPTNGTWNLFSNGTVQKGTGGIQMLNLTATPIPLQFVRIWMNQSSNTCDTHGPDDLRNCVGYAINELYGGILTDDGEFVDIIVHRPSETQTYTYCSSIDPWHSATDIVTQGVQTGFDLFFTSGYTRNLPAIVPVSVLYGTPDDSAAQIEYLLKRGYPISYIEMGEEPDGQFVLPETYAELYLQWATAIHRVNPNLKLGGPVFTGQNDDVKIWPDAQGRTSWMGRFVDYLKSRGRIQDLAFISFEHYPFDPCDFTWSLLYSEPYHVAHIMQVWKDDGVPDVPMLITESNISWQLTKTMDEIFQALWLADNVGAFFNAGGDVMCHSPVQPEVLHKGCDDWGTYGNFVAGDDHKIVQYTSGYHASRLINYEWVTHGAGIHRMFSASSDVVDHDGNILVTAYALHCPNGEWSLLLVNRDQNNSHPIVVDFKGSMYFDGTVKMVTFGSEQYVWHASGPNSRADPDEPPVSSLVKGGKGTSYTLPKASVTVLRGDIK